MKTQKYNHITRVLVAVGLFSMVIPALAAQVPPGTALAEKQELVRNNGSEPSSLDPHKVESDVENNIISDLFEGLVSVSPAGEIEPRLAEKDVPPASRCDLVRRYGDYGAGYCLELAASGVAAHGVALRELSRQYAYRQRGGDRAGAKSARDAGRQSGR